MADLPLHVCVPSGERAPSPAGVVGHQVQLADEDRAELAYSDPQTGALFLLPVVSSQLMLAQVATVLSTDDVVAVADCLLAGEVPLCTPEDLALLAERYRGRPGAKRLAAAIPHARVGSKSRPETLLRLQIVRASIPEPLINCAVLDDHGTEVGTPDGQWPDRRVLYEYEGDHHRRSRGRFRTDITRVENYLDLGWDVLRIHAGDVFGDPNPMLARLARLLREGEWHPRGRHLRKVAAAEP